MSRITRAKAAEVAEKLHIDEDALLELNSHNRKDILLSPTAEERTPLCEVSPNSASSKTDAKAENENSMSEKKSKKRARKGKKTNALNASTTSAAPDDEEVVIPDKVEAAQSPASQATSDDLVREIPELEASHIPVHDIRPTTPLSNAVRMTRNQVIEDVSQSEPVQTVAETLVSAETMPNVLQFSTPTKTPSPARPELSDMENVDPNGEEYDRLEKAVVDASTPPRSDPRSPMIPAASPKPTYDQLETAVLSASKAARNSVSAMLPDPIEALDAQDEAVEKIAAEVPDVQDSPQKPQSKKSVPPVRLTKASQARISLAHGLPDAPSKAPAMGRPRQSMSQSTSKRITSTSSAKSGGDAAEDAPTAKKEVVIPHSKPRPMSMQFKPPPPPAKSTKAPTQSNFQLPGEAVAAKFKAAREARQQKEAEEQKKKAFKARPVPNMSKTPAVRQTSTSKARESIMNPGKPLAASVGTSRPMSVATSRPATTGRPTTSSSKSSATSRPSTARVSIAPSSKTKDLAVKKRPISMMVSSTSKPRPATVLGTSTSKTRPATVLGMNSRPRASLAPKPNPPAAESVRPTFQAGKGKEVFNRAAEAKATAEQQKRVKEEAAKKARLEASERSRQLSRDWAEKQRMKKMGTKPADLASSVSTAPSRGLAA